jgi:hypothetical protein
MLPPLLIREATPGYVIADLTIGMDVGANNPLFPVALVA